MRTDRLVSVVFLVPALLMAIGAWQLGLGTVRVPGPGFYPLVVAILICGLSLLQLLSTRPIAVGENDTPQSSHPGKVLAAILALVFFIVFLPLAGVAITSAIFLGALFRIGGIESNARIAVLSIVIAIVAELACRFAGIPLPESLIWQMLARGT